MVNVWKCGACGKLTFPRHTVCPKCGFRISDEIEITDEGSLVTYTLLYAPPAGFEETPLALGIAEFQGVMVTGQLTTVENLEIGMKVKSVYSTVREINGKEYFGYKFQPREE